LRKLRFEDLKLVDETEVPQKQRGSDWLELFKKIDAGKALEIPDEKAAPTSIREAVRRLKESGLLPDSFVFTTRRQKDGKYVSYVINSGNIEKRPQQERGPSISEQFNVQSVIDFISSKPNCEHSLPSIQKHFLGKILSSREDESTYHKTYNIVKKARKTLEKKLGGRFAEKLGSDGVKVYRFQKSA